MLDEEGMRERSRTIAQLRNSSTHCHYCDRRLVLPGTMSAEERPDLVKTNDHKKPRLHGGDKAINNIVIACSRCNNLRSHVAYDVFKKFADLVVRSNPDASTINLRIVLSRFLDDLLCEAVQDQMRVHRAVSRAIVGLDVKLGSNKC